MTEARSSQVRVSRGPGVLNVAACGIAAALAAMVFYIDTFTDIESAIAVLYGLSILMAADVLGTRATFVAAVCCCGLTIFAFLLSHWSIADGAKLLRLVVSLCAIMMTTAVLYRHARSKRGLVESNEAFQRSERRYRAIFEQSSVALWEQDFTKLRRLLSDFRDNRTLDIRSYAASNPSFLEHCATLIEIVNVNNATLVLLDKKTSSEVTGPLRKFLSFDDSCLIDLVECVFAGRTRFEGKTKLVRCNGERVSVLVGVSFPEDGIGYERVVVGMFDVTQSDLSQQAKLIAQSEMARASRFATVGALSASIAHELNQPIGAVVLNAQSVLRWLRRDPPDIHSATEAADRIVRDGHRAAEILRRTREMVMRNPPQAEALNLVELVGETCLLLEHELTSTSIVLQTKMPAHLPYVKVAKAEFQQVLVNLLNNGIQAIAGASGEQRKIEIECAAVANGQVLLSVRDHGPGINPEQMARLFDPFFTTKPNGMGIGLAISRAIIEVQGGKLIAKNHEKGGAVFEVRLPVEVNNA